MSENCRVAGRDRNAVAFARFVPRDEFEQAAGNAKALEFWQRHKAGDAFRFLPTQGGDRGTKRNGPLIPKRRITSSGTGEAAD